jgi:hypothetical protein
MKLIAKWKSERDCAFDEPSSITWEDGSRATLATYHAHSLATYALVANEKHQIEKHIYPDIVAIVVFEPVVNDWVVKGTNVRATALGLNDIAASDGQIYGELATFPVVYKARIIRPNSSSVAQSSWLL